MSTMIIERNDGRRDHYICFLHPRMRLGDDGQQVCNETIPIYTHKLAIETGWRETNNGFWVCPDCARQDRAKKYILQNKFHIIQ